MREFWKDEKVRKTIFIGAVLITLYLVLSNIGTVSDLISFVLTVFSPFILGAALAFVLNVPISKLEEHIFVKEKYQNEKWAGRRRTISMLIVVLLAVIAVVCIILLVVPELARTIVSLAKQIPEGIDKFSNWLLDKTKDYPKVSEKIKEYTENWEKALQPAMDYLQNKGASIISDGVGIITGVITGVTSFLISFVFSLYILGSKERLCRQGRQVTYTVLSEKKADKFLHILRTANTTFSGFISGQCLDAFMLGCEFIIVLTITNMPYVMLIGIMIMLLALIPLLGAFIGFAIGFLLILLVSPVKAVIFAVIFILLQQIDANLIYPHIVGSSVGLPGMWVLLSVTVGGTLFGITGMLVMIPIASVLYAIIRENIYERLKEKGIPEEKYMEDPVLEKRESVLKKEITIRKKKTDAEDAEKTK